MGFGVRERSSSEIIIRLLRSGNSRLSRINNQPKESKVDHGDELLGSSKQESAMHVMYVCVCVADRLS
jgi:hypothetical protein